jgi:3-dehydroquinate dehydratase / shikimate dehydrogenase
VERPLLCSTVTGDTTEALRAARDAAGDADMVEVRLDTARDPDAVGAVAGRRLPVLVTCRASWEGGHFGGAEEEREALLLAALDAGADFVDVEFAAACRERVVARDPKRVVVSAHDFSGVPTDLRDRVRAMRATGAAVVKAAVMTKALSEQLALFDLAASGQGGDSRHVLLAMGEAGVASRILAARLGNAWTYAGHAVAPGQIAADVLLGQYGFRRIAAGTPVYAVVGRPIAHSLSPVMHNAALQHAGLDGVYIPLAARDFADLDVFAHALGIDGISVTAPFKLDALHAAADVAPVARRTGAANTLKRRPDGAWDARNTDVEGFLAALHGESLGGRRATVLGAGGAARSVIAALLERNGLVSVSARREEAAAALAHEWGVGVAPFPPVAGTWDLLVNTTPVGTWPRSEECPIPSSAVRGPVVYDLVYNPSETALLKAAAANGAKTIGGLEMLVAQAAGQFEWWTGHAPSKDVMQRAAEAALSARAAATARAEA